MSDEREPETQIWVLVRDEDGTEWWEKRDGPWHGPVDVHTSWAVYPPREAK